MPPSTPKKQEPLMGEPAPPAPMMGDVAVAPAPRSKK
jgi:hypothetical protein